MGNNSNKWYWVSSVDLFLEFIDQFVYIFKTLQYLFETSGTCYYYFAWYEDQKCHFWMFLSIDQSWEELGHELDLRGITFSVHVVGLHLLEVDREFYICWCYYVLDFEFAVFDGKVHLLYYFCVFSAGSLAFLLGPGSSYNHFSAAEDETGGFGVSESHYDGGKAIGVVLSGFAFPGNLFEI